MDIFGMGIPELLVIMMLALILFGPGKLPEIAAGIGRAAREFRSATRELTAEFEQAFREVQSSTAEVATSVMAIQQETHTALQEVGSTVQGTLQSTVADQTLAPVTQPASPEIPPPASSLPSPQDSSTAHNGQKTPSKEDPLADLLDVDKLLDSPAPVRNTSDETVWER